MATTDVHAESMPMNDGNESASEIQTFMDKYKQVDKDRKKYMICFFALFGLVIIFLIIILVGLTASSNESTPSNIDTCHADCSSSENDFVTLKESDTDKPVATYWGWLDVTLQKTYLLNYSRALSSNGTILREDDPYIYLLGLRDSLGIEDGGDDVYTTIEYQIYQGSIDYDYLVKACNILYTGHSSFTLRTSIERLLATTKYISNLQITSEQCDNEISNGLPTNDAFTINDKSYVVECINGDNDLCQVYLQDIETFNLNNFTIVNKTNTTENGRRRLYKYLWCMPCPPSGPPERRLEEEEDEGCFPLDAIVNTPDGDKYINELNIGDKVLSVNSYSGILEYSEVFAHGHKIKEIIAEFVTLKIENGDFQVSATNDHFIYVCDKMDCDWNGAVYKRFGKVIVNNDYIFDNKMNKHLVVEKKIEFKTGLYNPYVLNGNIVVNNLIVSCHSEWFLDDLFGEKYEVYLPIVYQFILKPIEYIYFYIPNSWLMFNTFYPYGTYDIEKVNMFDFMKQVFWSLFMPSS